MQVYIGTGYLTATLKAIVLEFEMTSNKNKKTCYFEGGTTVQRTPSVRNPVCITHGCYKDEGQLMNVECSKDRYVDENGEWRMMK